MINNITEITMETYLSKRSITNVEEREAPSSYRVPTLHLSDVSPSKSFSIFQIGGE
jgi:hypothetical protein